VGQKKYNEPELDERTGACFVGHGGINRSCDTAGKAKKGGPPNQASAARWRRKNALTIGVLSQYRRKIAKRASAPTMIRSAIPP